MSETGWPPEFLPNSPSPDDPEALALLLWRVRINERDRENHGYYGTHLGALYHAQIKARRIELEEKLSRLVAAPAMAPQSKSIPPKTTPTEPVVLAGPDKEVIVWGKRKPPLPPAQYRVIKALAEAHAKGERLSKDMLSTRTKDDDGNSVEDPVGALKRLIHDPVWQQVIDMAGIPGRGYGLNDPPTSHLLPT
jgi:hypothetical protein